jgi:hypothetical protein
MPLFHLNYVLFIFYKPCVIPLKTEENLQMIADDL